MHHLNSRNLFRLILSFVRNDFFQKVLIVILFSSTIMLADSAFQVFSPCVQIIEINVENNQIVVFKYWDASVYYCVDVVKTYWIKMPMFPIRGLNLSLPNPSNFSVYDSSQYLSWEKKPFAIKIETDVSISYSTQTDSTGKVTSISIMPINGSLVKPRSSVRLTYKDALGLQLISQTQPIVTTLSNGSTLVNVCLIINNTEPRRLHANDFALFSVQDYGNLTLYSLLRNGIKIVSPWHMVLGEWLWTSFSVDPHTFVNMTISAVFEEKMS